MKRRRGGWEGGRGLQCILVVTCLFGPVVRYSLRLRRVVCNVQVETHITTLRMLNYRKFRQNAQYKAWPSCARPTPFFATVGRWFVDRIKAYDVTGFG